MNSILVREIRVTKGADARTLSILRSEDGSFWLHDIEADNLVELQDDSDAAVMDAVREGGFELAEDDQFTVSDGVYFLHPVGSAWLAADVQSGRAIRQTEESLAGTHAAAGDVWAGIVPRDSDEIIVGDEAAEIIRLVMGDDGFAVDVSRRRDPPTVVEDYTVRIKHDDCLDPNEMSRSVYVSADSPSAAIVEAMCQTDNCHGGDYRLLVEVYPGHHGYQSPTDRLAQEAIEVKLWTAEHKQDIGTWFTREVERGEAEAAASEAEYRNLGEVTS